MSPTPKRWDIAPPMPAGFRARFSHLNHILAQALYNRGVTSPEDVRAFLEGRGRFHDPFRLLGVSKAVDRIRAAIRAGEPIVVYGDFDADGVTATALLVQTLQAFGGQVSHYIPHRVDEGYGLHKDTLDRIAGQGARLLITVDCGIRSPEETAHAQNLGMDVIVTDHHSIYQDERGVQQLPPALAVINPKRAGDPYPCKDLAGVGVAFKLAQALLLADRAEPISAAAATLTESDLLDLVALGTVADLAPLLGENRSLVQRGLAELNQPRRPGIQAMLEEAGLLPGRVNAMAIGFILGPRLNAAGRLKTAETSYELLTTPDPLLAHSLADELGHLNRWRQEETQTLTALARRRIAADSRPRHLYLAADAEFNPGIVGLVAGRLAEELYRPVFIAQIGPEETHGSARSIAEFDVTAALDRCRDLLKRHGGHAMAAGFTVRNERLPALQARLEEIAAEQLAGQDLLPSLEVDAVSELNELDWAVHDLLQQLEPCGYANPQPVLASLAVEVVTQRAVGADRRHLKLVVRDPHDGQEWDAIAFGLGGWFGQLPHRIDLAYTLDANEFGGDRKLQLNVRDLRPAVDKPS